jgi:hypothetical protein
MLIAITIIFTLLIHTSFAIMRLFHNFSFIFNTLLPTLIKALCTNVEKFPALTSEHTLDFVLVRCHLQNGIHVVHPLWGQPGASWRMPHLTCEEREEQSIPFLKLPHM